MNSVYLYGMVLLSNSFLLKEQYPCADSYGEIKEKYSLPGGETGTCATVLDSLGCQVLMDGNHLGYEVYPTINAFYQDKSVDLSPMLFDENYDGLQDYIIIDQYTRTPFGMFQSFYSEPTKRWNTPRLDDIKSCKVAGIDPFFGEQSELAAKYCIAEQKGYVTIDCHYESLLHQNSSINILSNEFFHLNRLEDIDREWLFKQYIDSTDGLVIFTNGSRPLWYGRKGTGIKTFEPYSVDVVSTLGAGDTFKAGCIYALLHQMSDEETVSFASACAAVACTKFPLPLNPPTLEDIDRIMKK